MDNSTLISWREEGRSLIENNFSEFRRLVVTAKNYLENDDYEMAAIYGEIAASYASSKHPGLFASPELEHLLLAIGKKIIQDSSFRPQNHAGVRIPQKVLHVGTSMASVGGHSKMLRRWIAQDSERSHSLVLTRQFPNKIPEHLSAAISSSQGTIYILNNRPGSIISWAKRLREIASSADLIVLHIHNYDVIPILAFAAKEQCPTVAFLDHADHIFWIGKSVSDVVISLRESGMKIARQRRGVAEESSVLLPINLEPIHRRISRNEAKKCLNIAEGSTVILSIARGVKYKTINGISFADAHVSLLKKYKNVILLVVGAGEREDWSTAIQETDGRIRSFRETSDTSIYYQAADIYVDSYPFSSNTSLLEAGCYEVPLVTRFPYLPGCEILGADAPGLTNHLIRVKDLEEYTSVLSRLVQEEEYRNILGRKTRQKILSTHVEKSWQKALEETYAYIMNSPKLSNSSQSKDKHVLDEPDILIPRVFGLDADINRDILLQWYISLMPTTARFSHWLKLSNQYGVSRYPVKLLLPEWGLCHYYFLKSYCSDFLNKLKTLIN